MDIVDQLHDAIKKVGQLAETIVQIGGKLAHLLASTPSDGENDLPGDIAQTLKEAVDLRRMVGNCLSGTDLSPSWKNKAELVELLETAIEITRSNQTQNALSRLHTLGRVLSLGRVNHHLRSARERLDSLRIDAASELSTFLPPVPDFPGPDNTSGWLEWFWTCGDIADQIIERISGDFPRLSGFLEATTASQWESGPQSNDKSSTSETAVTGTVSMVSPVLVSSNSTHGAISPSGAYSAANSASKFPQSPSVNRDSDQPALGENPASPTTPFGITTSSLGDLVQPPKTCIDPTVALGAERSVDRTVLGDEPQSGFRVSEQIPTDTPVLDSRYTFEQDPPKPCREQSPNQKLPEESCSIVSFASSRPRDTAWKLLAEDRAGLAYHILSTAEALGNISNDAPSDLFRAAALSRFVSTSSGPIVDELRSAIEGVSPIIELRQDINLQSDMPLALVMLGLSLRPTLLAPAAGTVSVLQMLSLDGPFQALGAIHRTVVEFGLKNLELSPSVLKGVQDHVRWKTKLTGIIQETRGWLDSNRQASIIYAATTDVWHSWLSDQGPLGSSIKLLIDDQRDRSSVVRQTIEHWSQSKHIDKQIETTDYEIRKIGARRRPIEARARKVIHERVREFTTHAQRWLDHVSTAPEILDDFRKRRADETRASVQQALPAALQEAEQLTEAGGSPALSAAAKYLTRALKDLERLFDVNQDESAELATSRQILSSELLANSALELDDDWKIIRPEPIAALELLGALADRQYDIDEAFRAHAKCWNHTRTEQVIENARIWGADSERLKELREQREDELRLCRPAFRRMLVETRAAVEGAVCHDLITGDDRARYLVSLESYAANVETEVDFTTAVDVLKAIESAVDRRKQARVLDVQHQFDTLIATGQAKERPADLDMIKVALERGDFATADEYLGLVRNHQPVVRPSEEQRLVFREFFGGPEGKTQKVGFAQDFYEFLEPRDGRKPHPRELIDRIRNGDSIGPLDMRGVSKPQAHEAAETINAWLKLKDFKEGRGDVGEQLKTLLTGVGFGSVVIAGVNRWKSPHWLTMINTAEVADPNVCIIPKYGSLAKGRYRILGLYDRPDEETLVNLAREAPGSEPLLVLFFGRLNEIRRRNLAELCWSRGREFLLLDEVLVYFLAGERSSRLPILFQCALPFTVAKPYTTTASLVPIEMFFGREQERRAVFDLHGTNLVYGGRQLGKSALLRDVERRYHTPQSGTIVRWIDLKNRGIGIDRPISDLWSEIGLELYREKVLIKQSANYQTVIDRVKEWLSKDDSRRILLLLDEADAFLELDSRDINRQTRHSFPEVARLKRLMDDTERRFKVVFAGLHNVQRAARDPNTPVGHLGTPVCIGPLLDNGEWRQARDLVEIPLRHMGYELDPPDLWMRILSYTNYYPSLIQVFCKHLLEHLQNKDRATFDFRRCPPYAVTAVEIEDVYQTDALRGEIRHKFELTLGLDARYRLIAIRIALAGADRASDAAGVNVEWVRREALSWWPAGFPAEDRSYELFRTILDEMVGLGILRKSGDDRYSLRSANVLNLLGSKDQIETKLEDVMTLPPPPVYEAATFRRALGSDPWTRSPLTAEQEAKLAETENGVAVIFASQLSGLDNLAEGLRAIPNLTSVVTAGPLTQLNQFDQWLHEVDKGRMNQQESGGVTLAVVDSTTSWSMGWVQRAVEFLKLKTTSRRRFMRLVFIAHPNLTWEWAAEQGLQGAVEIALRPWQETALRRWMEDVDFGPDAVGACSLVRQDTGGWGILVNEFSQSTRTNPQDWKKVLSGIKLNWEATSHTSGCADLPRSARTVLAAMADWNDPIDDVTLEEVVTTLTEPIGKKDLSRTIWWADRLGYINRTSENDATPKWSLDPVIRAAIVRTVGN